MPQYARHIILCSVIDDLPGKHMYNLGLSDTRRYRALWGSPFTTWYIWNSTLLQFNMNERLNRVKGHCVNYRSKSVNVIMINKIEFLLDNRHYNNSFMRYYRSVFRLYNVTLYISVLSLSFFADRYLCHFRSLYWLVLKTQPDISFRLDLHTCFIVLVWLHFYSDSAIRSIHTVNIQVYQPL